jgi:hypothetical protein
MCLPGRGKATGFSVARPHFPVIGQARDDDSESVPTSNNNVVYPGALKRRRVLLFLSCRTCRMRSEFRGSSLCSAAFRPHVARNHAHALARGQHVHGAGNGRRQACPLPWRATRCMGRASRRAAQTSSNGKGDGGLQTQSGGMPRPQPRRAWTGPDVSHGMLGEWAAAQWGRTRGNGRTRPSPGMQNEKHGISTTGIQPSQFKHRSALGADQPRRHLTC